MRNNLNRKLFLASLLFLFVVIFFIGSSLIIQPRVIEIGPKETVLPAQISETFPSQTQPAEDKTISIILVGDIMLDRGVEYMMKEYNNWQWPFLKIADDLREADILFGNLEGPISDKGTKVGSIYSFRADPKVIEGLTHAGFDVLSIANNHAFDYGRESFEDTLLRLKEAGIDYVGGGFNKNEAYGEPTPVIKDYNPPSASFHPSLRSGWAPIKGTKVAFLAYTNLGFPYWAATENSSGIAWVDWENLEEIKKDIQEAKNQVDILIVSLHSGEEYSFEPTQFQIEFAKAAIDAGADLVFGHHPHVIQRSKRYKNGWVFYSLGNFVFDQGFSEETMQGQILKILIENKKIKEVIPINIRINEFFQPEIEILPKIFLSTDKVEQGDTILIRIESQSPIDKPEGKLESEKINFFKLEKDWLAILGVDAKKEPGKYNLIINFPDGEHFEKGIEIIERKFPITELLVTEELREKGYTPSKIAKDIATKENLMIKEVLSVFTPEIYFDKLFIYPLKEIKDIGAFGNIRKSENISLQHLGVDLEAPLHTPVYAINDGVVRFSENLNTYGKTLIIDHGLGIFSLYLHLDEFKVLNEDEVKRGDIIGFSGNTGYSIAPHLHFAVKVNGASVDPLRFIETIEKEMIK